MVSVDVKHHVYLMLQASDTEHHHPHIVRTGSACKGGGRHPPVPDHTPPFLIQADDLQATAELATRVRAQELCERGAPRPYGLCGRKVTPKAKKKRVRTHELCKRGGQLV